MPSQEKCRVLENKQVSPRDFKLIFASDNISSQVEPGQFVNVRVSEGYDPLLRRPFSLHRINKDQKSFEILYEVRGKGTEILSQHCAGIELDVLGPLGKGFEIDKDKKIAILVGGGMGVAPLLALADKLKQLKQTTYALLGMNSRDRILCEKDFKAVSREVLVSTDDGSYGQKGFISDTLLDFLNNRLETDDRRLATIYACGPRAMLKAVAGIAAQKKIDCQVSMEEHMACGIGTCLGCVVNTQDGYKKVCDDGPVFRAREITW